MKTKLKERGEAEGKGKKLGKANETRSEQIKRELHLMLGLNKDI